MEAAIETIIIGSQIFRVVHVGFLSAFLQMGLGSLPTLHIGLSAVQSDFNTRIDSDWIEAVRNCIYLVSSHPHYNYSNQFKLHCLRHLTWFQCDLLMAFTGLLLVFLFYLRLRSRHRRNRAVRARMRWLRQLALVSRMASNSLKNGQGLLPHPLMSLI